ncbi:MAG: 2-amino-4-hydroxy-6-hydroxymethyldihydropteridine diphosphokinase [Spirochaetales bacterium]|nr:2-amino-4-hydroxy-6-hydroxymethyldihydropteridine diphosphokinase [Spirochaetales bacterium]
MSPTRRRESTPRRSGANGVEVFLSIGSNLGDRLENLRQAVERLVGPVRGIRVSSVYETQPMYVVDQPPFLNVVVAGRTGLSPQGLLSVCLGIEAAMGRTREAAVPKGPRIIDVDILLYGRRVVSAPRLRIPHPLMGERQFVLVPLLELAPGLRDPVGGRRYAERLGELEDQGVYMFGPWEYTRGAPDRP